MARPNKGDRRQVYIRLKTETWREISHSAVDKHRDLSDLLVEVIETWWQKQPERARYERLCAEVPEAPDP